MLQPLQLLHARCDSCCSAWSCRTEYLYYEARSLTSAECNYTTGEQELLAVVHALRTWRCYLEGDKAVNIVTDHIPNTYLPTQPRLSRRDAGWSEFLQRFPTLSWDYKPGSKNVADPVSTGVLTCWQIAPLHLQGCPVVMHARQQRGGTVPAATAGPSGLAGAPAAACGSGAVVTLAAAGQHARCLNAMLLLQMLCHHYCWIISLPNTPLMHILLMALLRQMC